VHWNIHTATHCNTPTATAAAHLRSRCLTRAGIPPLQHTLQHAATYCNTHAATAAARYVAVCCSSVCCSVLQFVEAGFYTRGCRCTAKHTAKHCNILQHTCCNTKHCSILAATHLLQRTWCNTKHCNTLAATPLYCNTLHNTAKYCNIVHHTATHLLQQQQLIRGEQLLEERISFHYSTHCNMLQHTGTHLLQQRRLVRAEGLLQDRVSLRCRFECPEIGEGGGRGGREGKSTGPQKKHMKI